MSEYRTTYLSLGAGVQSMALYVLGTENRNDVPRPDVAVFADTGDEPAHVYRQLDSLEAWGQANNGPPIKRVSLGMSLSEIMVARWVPIPAFTINDGDTGMLLRQCTQEVKVVPIQRFIKEEWLGIKRGRRMPFRVRNLIGFSCEEVTRTKPSPEKWLTRAYPLIDAGLYRPHCIRIVEDAGLGTPKKSACVFCPYHSDRYWATMKRDDPESFAKAVGVDRMIRTAASRQATYVADGKAQARLRTDPKVDLGRKADGITADSVYIHRSCRPLDEVEFGDQQDLWDEECSGSCWT